MFGNVKVPGEWLAQGICNVLSGKCYAGGLECLAPPLEPRMPPAGVDWARGSLCPEDAHGRATASSAMGVRDSADGLLRADGAARAHGLDEGMARVAFDGVGADGKVWRAEEGVPQWLQYEFVELGDEGHRLQNGSRRVRIAGYGITARPGRKLVTCCKTLVHRVNPASLAYTGERVAHVCTQCIVGG